MISNKKIKISIIGLGYIGLPLLYELSKHFSVNGIDNKLERVSMLKRGIDTNNQLTKYQLIKLKNSLFTDFSSIKKSNVYIITVPTPVFQNNKPNINALVSSTKSVSKIISIGDTVIYESTVYPGLIEDLAKKYIANNKFIYNKTFFLGYSPERMNPGDKIHTLKTITKIVSGSDQKTTKLLEKIYSKVCDKIHVASTIKIAESSKIIENVQRDINIALVNEFSQLFFKLGVPFRDVLEAAKTKWNFIDFRPGIVGGHCIGVDPYYLTYIAKKNKHNPKLILNGRTINDKMYVYITKRILSFSKKNKQNTDKINLLLLGLTFKENCNDIRNSQSIRLYHYLKKKFKNVYAYEPNINNKISHPELKNINMIKKIDKKFDIIVLSVAHKEFMFLNKNKKILNNQYSFIFDIKWFLKPHSKIVYL